MSEWKKDKLNTIAQEVRILIEPSGKEIVPYIGLEHISQGDLSLIGQGLSSDAASTKKVFKKGDILFGTLRPYFRKVVRPNFDGVCSTDISVLKAKKGNSQGFLFYLVASQPFIDFASVISNGTKMPRAKWNVLAKTEWHLPEPKEQHCIASILSAYDDLIENNNRRIALLEQMAEQIYKEWFVRMRFPGYQNTEFEKGVPKGWEVKSIKDFGKVVTGKTPSTSNSGYFGGKFPFIKTPDMHGNIFVLQTEETLTEDGFNSQKSQALPANSICVSCIGTGGVVSITPSVCMTNQQINSLILKNKMELEFLFFTLRGLKTMIEMFGSTGATMTNLSKGKFENLKFIKPKDEFIEKFCLSTKPILNEIKNLSQQQITLKQIRDLLLPRLISGKLKVNELKEFELV